MYGYFITLHLCINSILNAPSIRAGSLGVLKGYVTTGVKFHTYMLTSMVFVTYQYRLLSA